MRTTKKTHRTPKQRTPRDTGLELYEILVNTGYAYQLLVEHWDGHVTELRGRSYMTEEELIKNKQHYLMNLVTAKRARLLTLPTGRILANYHSHRINEPA